MSEKLPPKILVIEYDETISTSICNTIERSWFDVIRVDDYANAVKIASATIPNIIIISSRIKTISAIDVAASMRNIPQLAKIPIIFLLDAGELITSYQSVTNELVELVYRPFTPHQLIIAIKSLLRRSAPVFQDKILKYKNISIDLAKYKVFLGDQAVHIGPTEFKILQLFMQEPKTTYSRKQIIEYVWGPDKRIEARTVDVHINRLRNILKDAEKYGVVINTIRDSGYCLSLSGEE